MKKTCQRALPHRRTPGPHHNHPYDSQQSTLSKTHSARSRYPEPALRNHPERVQHLPQPSRQGEGVSSGSGQAEGRPKSYAGICVGGRCRWNTAGQVRQRGVNGQEGVEEKGVDFNKYYQSQGNRLLRTLDGYLQSLMSARDDKKAPGGKTDYQPAKRPVLDIEQQLASRLSRHQQLQNQYAQLMQLNMRLQQELTQQAHNSQRLITIIHLHYAQINHELGQTLKQKKQLNECIGQFQLKLILSPPRSYTLSRSSAQLRGTKSAQGSRQQDRPRRLRQIL